MKRQMCHTMTSWGGPILGTDEPPARGRSRSERRDANRREPTTGPHFYRQVPEAIRTALQGALTKYPDIRMADVLAATSPTTPYNQVKLGAGGACLDFLALGRCKKEGCTFQHPTDATISAVQVSRASGKLRAAYASYDAAHS
jgi:hypothetical protein